MGGGSCRWVTDDRQQHYKRVGSWGQVEKKPRVRLEWAGASRMTSETRMSDSVSVWTKATSVVHSEAVRTDGVGGIGGGTGGSTSDASAASVAAARCLTRLAVSNGFFEEDER